MKRQDEVTPDYVCGGMAGNKKGIPLSSVIYFRADTKYVFAVHEQGELILTLTLKQIEEALGGLVVPVSRSALVMMDRLGEECASRIDRHVRLSLKGSSDRPIIARRRLRDVRVLLRERASDRKTDEVCNEND